MRGLVPIVLLASLLPLLSGCATRPDASASSSVAAPAEDDEDLPDDWQVSGGTSFHYAAATPGSDCRAFTFEVPAGARDLVAGAGRALVVGRVPPGVGAVHIEVVDPAGAVLTDGRPDPLRAGPVDLMVPTFVQVADPAPGTWTVRVTPSTPMANQDVDAGYAYRLRQIDEPAPGQVQPATC